MVYCKYKNEAHETTGTKKMRKMAPIFQVKKLVRITYTVVFMGIPEQKVYRCRSVDSLPVINMVLNSCVGTQYFVQSIDKIEIL